MLYNKSQNSLSTIKLAFSLSSCPGEEKRRQEKRREDKRREDKRIEDKRREETRRSYL
jgi:hypothetical protein